MSFFSPFIFNIIALGFRFFLFIPFFLFSLSLDFHLVSRKLILAQILIITKTQ